VAALQTSTRNALPPAKFGLPKQRKYPMPDKVHAVNAKARAKQQLDMGKLGNADYRKIRAKADKKLKEQK
jgi:hypothetical protein